MHLSEVIQRAKNHEISAEILNQFKASDCVVLLKYSHKKATP